MLKAVLFDDEFIVLEALGALVDWKGLGIELAGTASDGLSAMELFRRIRPDIVLTDIRMPGKDGLQLIGEIMDEAPETCCIVFSGFNEFDYVKRAIRLGVVDYIEKPITEISIEQALRKALGQIGKQEETRKLERLWEASKHDLLEKAVWDLLLRGREAENKWREVFGPQAGQVHGITVLAAVEPFKLPDHPAYRTVYLRSDQSYLAVVFCLMELSNTYWDDVSADLENANVAVGLGNERMEPGEVPDSLKEAQRALRSALFLGVKGFLPFGELGGRMTSSNELPEREEAIILSMRAGNKAMLMEQVDRFIQWIQTSKLDPDLAESEMLKLIYSAWEAAKETGVEAGRSYVPPETFVPHLEIREMAAKGKLTAWFRDRMESIAESGMNLRENTKHTAVQQARRYIESNLARDVSLQEVADHVGLNATYLSVLFKEVMGETYIKYLTRFRMERAKSLLRKGLKVNEVSEKVGYLTHRHFTEVFKKYTGQTPGQFKDS
ncbi:response regulator transcription factor [Cohnella candidum]|uniref:Response regulator n=1 Tax=Cohnella candidum TaxID=2674991 RepID=A0A3G3JTH6_9BACL|nr:response regulator [Cohnella candidum]AYQ71533.1 response regulator [Cohnella candidum]